MTRLPSFVLCAGGAELQVIFERIAAAPPRPLRSVRFRGRPYPAVLYADILEPYLRRWTGVAGEDRRSLPAVTEAAMERCLACFTEVRKDLANDPGEAVLAALTVTANLQRTLIGLGERLASPAGAGGPEVIRLARSWCGFPPLRGSAAQVGPTRALGRALGCPPQEVEPRCQEALRQLRTELTSRRGRTLAPEDVGRYAKRSGAVRLRKSSM